MSVLSWNCRGSGGSTISTLKRYIRCTGASITFVSETRCGIQVAEARLATLAPCNFCAVPSNGQAGGLWLIWDPGIDIRIIKQNINMIAAWVPKIGDKEAWILIAVYGDPHRRNNPNIWNEIEEFLEPQDMPVCILGDFNAIMSTNEKRGGVGALSADNRRFRAWIHSNGLVDLGHHGPAYTWSNKQGARSYVSSRLDRALANIQWTVQNPESAVFHLPRFNSDHLPVLLRTNPKRARKMSTFRCESWWVLKPGFKEVCEKAAEQGGNCWEQVTKSFKQEVKQWRGENQTPESMLTRVEKQMETLLQQQDQSPQAQAKEKELQIEHEKILLMQERFWHQRSRVSWIMYGDRNSKFFHASTLIRRRRNEIRAIQREDGTWLSSETEIRQAFVAHFKDIYKGVSTYSIHECYPIELLQGLPKIPQSMHQCLTELPSAQEIHRALMAIGPHKAAGPDGFDAKTIQDNWTEFGPSISKVVTDFFSTGVMPSQISRSNLVLIPKVEGAAKVGQFRPISVCNLIYKIISKILSIRMRPFIGRCVSNAQTAFVPGREISENIVLLREILHSFQQKGYNKKDFCLKVDLAKAFDKMEWSYVREVLVAYGFPAMFTQWVMSCVQSAEYTLVFNGGGGGFLKPNCGLRQGCTLSPYIFILAMDLLSRSLQFQQQHGLLKGVKPAPSAPSLTCSLYADDLIIMGEASVQEAQRLMHTLQVFSSVSGQKVGPEKSSVWFSKATPHECKVEIAKILNVTSQAMTGKYLGSPILDGRKAHEFLIDRVSDRLKMWKVKLLSQAARLVLIKATLQSLPVFYMATTKLPTKVTASLTNLMRRFFWGKMTQERYLAYVSWERICRPLEEGGLGLKELPIFNDAILMKYLCKLASGTMALWAQVVRAKYIPRSLLWHTARTYQCSIFWRSLMNLRSKLIPHLKWKVGDGRDCPAFGEPWFEGGEGVNPGIGAQVKWSVSNLVEENTGQWNGPLIIQYFGYEKCMQILQLPPPAPDSTNRDVLVCDFSTTGVYRVKEMYKELKRVANGGQQTDTLLYKWIWKKGTIAPRVRLFLWKLINRALPLGSILKGRGIRGDNTCATCGREEEDVRHLIFQCDLARACWYGLLGLQTSHLMEPFKETLKGMISYMSEDHWTTLANGCWALWRCRNGVIYGGKIPDLEEFQRFYVSIAKETELINLAGRPACQRASEPEPYRSFTCHVDGSWTSNWRGGIGIIIRKEGELGCYISAATQACSPTQAEAQALMQAVQEVQGMGLTECSFYTDNQDLVQVINQAQPPMSADWRVITEVFELWKTFKTNPTFACYKIDRGENQEADSLAKNGRLGNWKYRGFTYPMFPTGLA